MPVDLRRRARRRLRPARVLADRIAGSIKGAVTDDPVVAFSYDDGPDPYLTPAVAERLRERGASATFFVLSARAEQHAAVVRGVVSRGHEVALHGAEHTRLAGARARDVAAIVRGGRRRLEEVAGARIRLFRPPYGSQSVRSYAIARASGLEVVGWSASAEDWQTGSVPDKVEVAMSELERGGILLLHDRYDPAVSDSGLDAYARLDLLDRLLDATEARGLRVVSVGELLRHRQPRREAWFSLSRRTY